jgi:DNA-directed RNA polymerase subunit RPC12/RpoP
MPRTSVNGLPTNADPATEMPLPRPVPARRVPGALSGDYRCSRCGDALSFHRGAELPECSLCRGTARRLLRWRPFTRRRGYP